MHTNFINTKNEIKQMVITTTADIKYMKALNITSLVTTELIIRAIAENSPAQAYIVKLL